MKTFTDDELDAIERMIDELCPAWGEAIVSRPDAPLPTAMPEVVGMSLTEAMMHALRTGSDQIRHDCTFEIWDGLPDRHEIQGYAGFHIICDALEKEEGCGAAAAAAVEGGDDGAVRRVARGSSVMRREHNPMLRETAMEDAIDQLIHLLVGAFAWRYTKQGQGYWMRVHDALIDIRTYVERKED